MVFNCSFIPTARFYRADRPKGIPNFSRLALDQLPLHYIFKLAEIHRYLLHAADPLSDDFISGQALELPW